AVLHESDQRLVGHGVGLRLTAGVYVTELAQQDIELLGCEIRRPHGACPPARTGCDSRPPGRRARTGAAWRTPAMRSAASPRPRSASWCTSRAGSWSGRARASKSGWFSL